MTTIASNDDEDRISSLPDGVLCHILSFLPTKYSVRTRVLSTRWKLLFTLVPVLDFYYSHFGNDFRNFVDFVNSVFILYTVSHMNKFRFHSLPLDPLHDHFPITLWISAAILRHVREIDVSVEFYGFWSLPLDLFSCKTLTVLKLQRSFYVALPRSVCLPCLKTCALVGVSFGPGSTRELFRNCPALEDLKLGRCGVGEGEVLDIFVPTLKRLTIHESRDNYSLVLNATNLLYFEYMGPAVNDFSGLQCLKSVVHASICYEWGSYTTNRGILELLHTIGHVQELYLSCDTMEAFFCSSQSLPTFNNLTRLSLGHNLSMSSGFLADLLHNSPRLEFLSFDQEYLHNENGADEVNYFLMEHAPACVSKHMKEIEFKCFSLLEYNFKLVEYFLKNAIVLDRMKIRYLFSCKTKLKITKEVLAFPRGSRTCKVVFE